MKKILGFLIGLFILVAVLVFCKNLIVKASIVKGVKAMTGVGLEVDSVNVGIVNSSFGMKGLKILNPDGFADQVMADFPEIYAHYNLGDFFKGKAHLQELRINLAQMSVIKNKNNVVNINSLKALMPKQGGGGKSPEVQIDALNLKIGKVIFQDYSLGKLQTREFNVNIDENFKNITDLKALTNLILVKALSKTTIASLANIDLSSMKQQASGILSSQTGTMVEKAKEKAQETLMQTQGAVQKFFGGTK